MTLTYAFDQRPDNGYTQPVADGLHWLRMPMPFALDHINLWLLEDDDGWTTVDTGLGNDISQEVWRTTTAELFREKPLQHVVVTHLHPDHVGCAGWLHDEYGAGLFMTRDEYLLCRVLAADRDREAPEEGIEFYHAAGFQPDQLQAYRNVFGFFGKAISPLPENYHRLQDGDVLAHAGCTWEVVTGCGHSPEHACFFDAERKLFISGDQLLPTISSNVSVYPTEPDANPLHDWLSSIAKLKNRLPEDVLVLPAHGKPFRGAHARLDALDAEHRRGLDNLLDHLREPRRAVDVFPALFKARITGRNLIMATGESIAHLNYLKAEGSISVEMDSEGVIWYRQT